MLPAFSNYDLFEEGSSPLSRMRMYTVWAARQSHADLLIGCTMAEVAWSMHVTTARSDEHHHYLPDTEDMNR